MPGEHLRINNIARFEQVLARTNMLMDQDPARVFETAAPGILGLVTETMGPWQGREELRWEVPGAVDDALVVARDERAQEGDYDMFHIVAEPGMEVAGRNYTTYQSDFAFGGMPPEKVAMLASRPRLGWNRTAARALMDTFTQGAFLSATDDFTENFAWTATDQRGNTVTQNLVTQDADNVATVVANSTQSVTWPLRDGEVSATAHDHVLTAAGATWTAAIGATARDLITEHPNNGRVVSYVGSNVAADVRALLKSEYGAIPDRVPFIINGDVNGGGFGSAERIGTIESVEYFHSPDIPDDIAVYVASNKKPLYVAPSAVGVNGEMISAGAWTENLGTTTGGEINGLRYGYRNWLTMGISDPTAIVVQELTA